MYSVGLRRMVVDLFHEDGVSRSRIAEFVEGELGDEAPSRGTMREWIRMDPRHGPAGRQGTSYTLEARLGAVRMFLRTGDARKAAGSVGCTVQSVYAWARRYREEGGMGLATGRDDVKPPAPGVADGDARDAGDVEALRRQVEALRLENAVMRETIRVLKADDPRLDPSMLTNGERARVVDAIRGEFGLARALDAMGLKRSTYYYERGAVAAGDRYAVLRARVTGLFEAGGRVWGYRRIHRMLRLDADDPLVVSEKVVRRIMREENLRPVYLRRAKRWSSYAGEVSEAPANLVKRDFHADAPNRLWVTDVTQFTMDGYKCWLSPVIDCFDGMVVSWTLSRSPNARMANRMLLDAVATLGNDERPVIHSDRGVHYRWPEWIRICEENGLVRSMSAKGCSPDNAAAEGFFGRLKNEFFHGRDWTGVGYQEFHERLAAYLTHYNETRIKKSLGWMSPVQYRKHLGLAA
ncbi:IS3 family transposase [Bifidobacterium simiarum]|uniref:IS3 family transposase n=1 Tax=Bifidobacterium simiarum TaxID=2045441 RepID=UPI001BDD023D|nr:IS3 family transposase [Bifidobacterium simiarum]MBT1167319.1 IS3 family transposase [Bifidobacterium simiarum]